MIEEFELVNDFSIRKNTKQIPHNGWKKAKNSYGPADVDMKTKFDYLVFGQVGYDVNPSFGYVGTWGGCLKQ